MANLSDSEDIQCASSDHDHYQEAACAHHEEHVMHDCVQLDHVVDSHDDYTSDSNIILCDQYVKDNEVPVIHSDLSYVPDDAFMMIYDDMCEPSAPSVSNSSWNAVVKNSLTAELATYREQVKLYERRAKFELTEREQKIKEQLRLVISDRNLKEETLKRELHSTKLQLASTINRNKSMIKEKQENDKIGSKPDKKGKRGKARKSLKQLQWIKEEKPKKTQKEWSKTHTRLKKTKKRTKIRSKPDKNRKQKSDAAKGFEQIIDFLSRSYIHYALTVSPHIYISCIKQFWNSILVKHSGDLIRLQALVDKKKIVISEDVIHEILQLNDAEGVVCLPNEEIFAGLAQMGYEKPSTKLVGDLSSHTTCFISPSLTQKVFANMRRVEKCFSGVETPLFEGMLVDSHPADEELGAEQVQVHAAVVEDVVETVAEVVSHNTIPSSPSHVIPSPLQEPSLPPQQPPVTPSVPTQGEALPANFHQVLNTCSALIRRVEHLERENVAQKLEIVKLKARVKKLEQSTKVKSLKFKRLRKIRTSRRVESSDDMEDVFNHGRMIADMDMNEGIELVKDVEEVVEVVTTAKLITKVTAAASQVSATNITIPAVSTTILAVSVTVPAAKPSIPAAYTRRRKGVIIRDPEEELPLNTPAET
nr:hypothetical protein [Tanacetum cinerariifolium]